MILKFFIEIRNRVFLIFLAWSVTFMVCYLHKDIILFLFINPCINLFKTNFVYFISTNLIEIFQTNIVISNFIAVQITILMTLYHTLLFFVPGLYKKEYLQILTLYLINIILLYFFISMLYNCILPKSWEFFISYQKLINNNIKIFFEAHLYNYVNFCITLYKIILINSQFIFILVSYVNFHKLYRKFIKTIRKKIYLVIIIISTIVTPPDILSQLIISTWTILVYESLILAIIIKKNLGV